MAARPQKGRDGGEDMGRGGATVEGPLSKKTAGQPYRDTPPRTCRGLAGDDGALPLSSIEISNNENKRGWGTVTVQRHVRGAREGQRRSLPPC
jgi:hypothetical protein